jgi:xylose isomerase
MRPNTTTGSSQARRPGRLPLFALLALALACTAPALTAAADGACAAGDDGAACTHRGGGALPAPDSIDYFPGVPERILYKGPQSDDPFSYRYYNADEKICAPAPTSGGSKNSNGNNKPVCKAMKDWLRMSVAFWHSMRADGSDPFGSATKRWPWGAEAAAGDARVDEMQLAFRAMHANFDLLRRLGLEFWSFHDR